MDHNNGSTIIGKQKMQRSHRERDTLSPLNTDGSLIHHIKNRNCRTNGLRSTASTSITSKTVNMDNIATLDERFLDRRRRPLHLRQPGGNPDSGSGGSQPNGTNHTKKNDGAARIGGKRNGCRLFQAM